MKTALAPFLIVEETIARVGSFVYLLADWTPNVHVLFEPFEEVLIRKQFEPNRTVCPTPFNSSVATTCSDR